MRDILIHGFTADDCRAAYMGTRDYPRPNVWGNDPHAYGCPKRNISDWMAERLNMVVLTCTCSVDNTPEVPAWVVTAWLRFAYPYAPADKPRTAFTHSFGSRIAKKDARPKVKRYRNEEHSQFPCKRSEHALVARPDMDEREAIAEGLEDARQMADMAAIDSYADCVGEWELRRLAEDCFDVSDWGTGLYLLEDVLMSEGVRDFHDAAYALYREYSVEEAERSDRKLARMFERGPVAHVPTEVTPEEDWLALMDARLYAVVRRDGCSIAHV